MSASNSKVVADRPRARAAGPVLLAYALSGAAALIYEVAWARLLTLHMGHTAAAASTVLAAYMGGLAVGSLAGGRAARHLTPRQALAAYAALEVAVAASALLLPFALSATQPALALAYADGNGGAWFGVVRLALTLLVLSVPTAAMGATFPVAVRALASDDAQAGREAAALYAANTIGAALGAALAGFVLLPGVGLRITTLTGCTLNGVSAACALLISRRRVRTSPHTPAASARRAVTGARLSASMDHGPAIARAGIAAAAVACSGFAALVNEVAWTRLLALILGPTSYAFSAMLVAVIAGLALGSWGAMQLSPRRPLAWLAVTLAVAALAVAGVLPLADRIPLIVARAVADPAAAFGPIVWLESALAAALLMPMTIAFGAAFPLAIRAAADRIDTVPRAAAGIYAANTAGAIGGALLAGFVLVPSIGLQRTVELSSVVLGVVAAGVAIASASELAIRVLSLAAGAVAIVIALAMPRWDLDVLAGGAYKYAPYMSGIDVTSALKAGTTLFYAEGATGTVTVRRVAGAMTLAIDGKIDASNRADMLTQKLLAHLPLLLHPRPREVCVIGLGSGVTAGAAAAHPVRRIDVVEISPEVVRASAFFRAENHDALHDPRTRLIVGDGRSHLVLARRSYDVIISEPSNPWIAGMSALFTREFFAAARERLGPGGFFCQWAHTYDMSRADLQSIVATFLDVFPAATAWLVGPGDMLLIGGPREADAPARALTANWQRPGVERDLAEVSVTTPSSLSSLEVPIHRILDGARNAPLQTDDRMALEYSAPRAIYGHTTPSESAQALAATLAQDAPAREALGPAPSRAWRDRGRMLLAAEAFDGAYDSFRRAVEGDPRDASALDGLADAARGATRVREAIALLESIRQHDSTNLTARVHLSHLLAAEGSWDAAIDVAREALALDPANATAREQLASIYADQEDAAHLAPLAAEMMRDSPDRASSHYYEGTTQFLAGNLAEAARFAEVATRIDRKHGGAWILAGAAYANLGDTARARRSFQSAIDADPRNPAGYLNLGMLEAASGELDRAAATLAEALLVDPTYEPARGALTDVLDRMGETTRAAALRRR